MTHSYSNYRFIHPYTGTTQKAGATTQKAGATTQKAGATTQKAGATTQKAGATTQKAGATTQKAGATTQKAGATTKGEGTQGTTIATICQINLLLDQPGTQVSVNGETQEDPAAFKDPFELQISDDVPEPVVEIVAEEPTTIMEIVVKKPENVEEIVAELLDEDGVVVDTLVLTEQPDVNFIFLFF